MASLCECLWGPDSYQPPSSRLLTLDMRLTCALSAGLNYAMLESVHGSEKIIITAVQIESLVNTSPYDVRILFSPPIADAARAAQLTEQRLGPDSMLLAGEGLLYSVDGAAAALAAGVRHGQTAAEVLAAGLGECGPCGECPLVQGSVLQRYVAAERAAPRTRIDRESAAEYAARIEAYASAFAPIAANAIAMRIEATEHAGQDGDAAGGRVTVSGNLLVTCVAAT